MFPNSLFIPVNNILTTLITIDAVHFTSGATNGSHISRADSTASLAVRDPLTTETLPLLPGNYVCVYTFISVRGLYCTLHLDSLHLVTLTTLVFLLFGSGVQALAVPPRQSLHTVPFSKL